MPLHPLRGYLFFWRYGMGLREFLKHLVISFFIILSCIVLANFVFMLAIEEYDSIDIETIGGFIVIAFLTNLAQLIVYSKKELSRGKYYFRICLCTILVVAIVMYASFYLEWFYWSREYVFLIIVHTFFVLLIVLIVVKFLSKHLQLRTAAYSDPLTKAYNRRFFMKVAGDVLNGCVKSNREFSLIMLDIDHFKRINDTHGHAIGDEVLKVAVARIKHVLKGDSFVVRFGGEEFIVMLTDKAARNAVHIAWRIQSNLASRPFTFGNLEVCVTASFGVASKKPTVTDLRTLIANCDKALYKAKDSGRNIVVSFDDED